MPAWTPLGARVQVNPVLWQGTLAQDSGLSKLAPRHLLLPGARAQRPGRRQPGGLGRLHLPPERQHGLDRAGRPAFNWTDYPDPPIPGVGAVRLRLPLRGSTTWRRVAGTTTRRTPFFTWKPLAGANSYFVVVAKDANFSNVVDEGFTRIPAYAPRNALKPTTYTDETTTYYWAVLPAVDADGTGALPIDLPNSAKGPLPEAVDASRA